MRVVIEGTEEETDLAAEALLQADFEYDVDYTALYGENWRTTGLVVMRRHADIFRALADAGLLEG